MEHGHKSQVISGVHEGKMAEIIEPHPSFRGFYRCQIGHCEADMKAQKPDSEPQKVALLHVSQLESPPEVI